MLEDGEDEDEGKKIDEMENAIIEYLGEGEDITIASNPRPGNNFPPTVKFMVCMLSAATGVPYELLIFDYSGINYASTRVIRNDFAHQLKPVRKRHIRGMCNPIAKEFLDSAVLNGRIKLRGYFEHPERYQRFGWTLPGNELIDWLKESKAGISELGVGIRSPQELVSSRGRDFDDVVTETRLAIKKLKDAELDFLIPLIWKDNSLASANNPAAIEDQGKNGNGSKSLSPQEAAAMNSRILSIMDDMNDKIDDIATN
jgi:capsid protein